MAISRMNSVLRIFMYLALGVVGLMLLQIYIGYLIGRSQPTTVIVESPMWRNYHGGWGQYGRGLPGWGGGYRGPPSHGAPPAPPSAPPAPASANPAPPPAPPAA